jgi:hypothetical protein
MWASVVGPEVARHSRPVESRSGVLRVAVESGVWAAQISFLRSDILGRLNAASGARLRELRFVVDAAAVAGSRESSAPPSQPEATADAEASSGVTDADVAAVMAQMAPLVQDEDVRRAWEGLVRAAVRRRRRGEAAGGTERAADA